VLVAVPVDELAFDHSESNDAIIHAGERLIHPRLIPLTFRGNVDLRQLTVLVVVPDGRAAALPAGRRRHAVRAAPHRRRRHARA
jgi:hypothetical protein